MSDTSEQKHDESRCWEPCGELGKSMEHAVVAPNDLISQTLIAKLATLVHYVEMERQGKLMITAKLVRDRLLDDPEVAAWADAHKNELLYTVRESR